MHASQVEQNRILSSFQFIGSQDTDHQNNASFSLLRMTHDHRGVFRKGLASFGGNNFRAQFKITETKNTFLTFC